jgi:hypothetical protein
MRPVKIFAVILGIVFALAGLASVTSGGLLLGVYRTHTDPSGFFNSPNQDVGSYGFALTVPNINATLGPRWENWISSRARLTVRVTGKSLTPAPVFIGVGPTARVSKYLAGVTHDKVTSIDWVAGSVQYSHIDGTTLPSAPDTQSFWLAKAQGSGTQTLEWQPKTGDWTVVIMNADASPPVAATMSVGARVGILVPIVVGLVAGGVVLLAIAATLIYFGARRRRPPPQPPYPPAVIRTPPPAAPGR